MPKNKDLYAYHVELNNTKDSIYAKLLKGRIQDFYKHNTIRINSIMEKLKLLQELYFELDGEGKVKEEGEGTERKPIMKDGMLFDEYMKEFSELMEKEISIQF